jgi:primosomal protein N' (replication factor Y)
LVAQVAVDVPLAHLDRPFDYAVPEDMAADVRVGCRVRVRFAGQLVDGVVLGLTDRTAHEGTLAPLAKLVSAEPVLTDDVAVLARAVADRWAGTLPDVLRLAIPPRRAAAEKREPAPRPAPPPPPDPAGPGRLDRAAQ